MKKIVKMKGVKPFTIRFIETNKKSLYATSGLVVNPEKLKKANEILTRLAKDNPGISL